MHARIRFNIGVDVMQKMPIFSPKFLAENFFNPNISPNPKLSGYSTGNTYPLTYKLVHG
jgi:hypothetical protein